MMTKACIKISQREIETRLLKLAFDAISKQISAMSKSLEMGSGKIDRSLENWQNFAPTLSDYNSSKWGHLDPS